MSAAASHQDEHLSITDSRVQNTIAMDRKIVRHSVKRHWPKLGISWPTRESAAGKHHLDPLPGQPGWLKRIQRAIDHNPRAPEHQSGTKTFIDLCFTKLISTAFDKCELLAEMDLLTFIEHVKEDVQWVEDLSVRCVAALFLAILNGRGLYKLHATHPVEENRCGTAEMMDLFQGRLYLVGDLMDIQISMDSPDGGDQLMDNGGVSGFIQRGLLHPENQLIAAELSEGIHRLRVTRRPQRDDIGLAEAIDQMGVGNSG